MSTSSSTSQSSAIPEQSPYQSQLLSFCRSHGVRTPTYQILSDRRGGRTAWSCTVSVHGQHIGARFWYDGQYVNNAKEDAAQVALQRLGQLPQSGVPPSHLQHQHQQQQQHQQQPQQPRFYGVIGS